MLTASVQSDRAPGGRLQGGRGRGNAIRLAGSAIEGPPKMQSAVRGGWRDRARSTRPARRKCNQLGRKQRGYSLAELAVVLAIGAFAMSGYLTWYERVADDAAVTRTVDAIARIDEALIAFRLRTGAWPTAITQLAAQELPNFEPVNGVGLPFTIAASGTGLVVGTTMENERQRTALLNTYPANSTETGAALGTCTAAAVDCGFELGVGLPGLEISHSALFLQDGSEPFLGDLDMDGNRIEDVDRVIFAAGSVIGQPCAVRSVSTTAGGDLLVCDGGVWVRGGGAECNWGGWVATNWEVDGAGKHGAFYQVVLHQCTGGVITGVAYESCYGANADPNYGVVLACDT